MVAGNLWYKLSGFSIMNIQCHMGIIIKFLKCVSE